MSLKTAALNCLPACRLLMGQRKVIALSFNQLLNGFSVNRRQIQSKLIDQAKSEHLFSLSHYGFLQAEKGVVEEGCTQTDGAETFSYLLPQTSMYCHTGVTIPSHFLQIT